MEYTRYIKVTLITVAGIVVSYILFNYFVDSLSIFHRRTEPFESYSDVNERFLKSLYLEEHCTGINTVLFGDSRTAGYVTGNIEKRFEHSTVFNYGVQADTLVGISQKLKWLMKNGCVPERIIVPLSIDRIELYDYADDARLLMQENPAVLKSEGTGGEYWLRQWIIFKKYLFSSSIFIKNINFIKNHVSDQEYHLKFIPATGDIYYYFDHPCENSPSEFGTIKLNAKQVDAFVKKLKSIYEFADRFGVEVILLWNPQLYGIQMSYDLGSSLYLLKNVAEISPYIYRVSLDDDRLKDMRYYHDCSHFKKELGKSVLDKQNYISTLELIMEFRDEHLMVVSQELEIK